MEVGDLVTALCQSGGVTSDPKPLSGVILKIEQSTEPDDGSFEPIVTLFTSNGMISVQGRQIATVDRQAKNCQ